MNVCVGRGVCGVGCGMAAGGAVKGADGRVIGCVGLGARVAGIWAMDEDDAIGWTGVAGAADGAPFFKGTFKTIGLFTVVAAGALVSGAAAGMDDAPALWAGSLSLILPVPPAGLEEAYCGRE